ncbi:unnamed protein product, partial [Porites evermanni]
KRSSQASAEENKRQRVEECTIHCSDETGDLVSLKDLESWKTLLNTAVIRNHEGILSIAKALKEGEIPRISYHRKCRSIFTLKRDLKKLSQSVIQVEEQEDTSEIPRISYHRKCRSIFTLKRDLKKLSQSVIQVEEQEDTSSRRSSIRQPVTTQTSWPPQPCELTENAVTIPDDLKEFLFTLLTGNTGFPGLQSCSEKVSRLITSFGQDLVFGASGGRQKPPKHILLPYAVKSLTNNVELIHILNRCGHGIAYSQLEEINTALCLQKLAVTSRNEVPLPDNIRPFINTTLAWDNIDRLEETLSGEGTSHRVNGIAVQANQFGPHPQSVSVPIIMKSKKRSIETVDDEPLPVYNVGERCGPHSRGYVEVTLNQIMEHLQDLVCLSTGKVATPDVEHDLLQAKDIGEKTYKAFREQRLQSNPPKVKFHYTITKAKLKTFTHLNKKVSVKAGRNQELILKADRRLFAQMIKDKCIEKLSGKTLVVTCGNSCYQLSSGVVQPISELESTQEEADTRMLLHSLHAARSRFDSVVIVSEDTDVLVLLLAFKSFIPSSVFIKCGSQTRVKYIEVSRIVESVGATVCRSLLGFHAFSGCDTVSAFAGRGKVVGYRIVTRNVEFQEMFQQLGMEWNLLDDLHHSLQKFTCTMYCSTPGTSDINELRYRLLQRCPDIPSPVGSGWCTEDGRLVIDWMGGQPAPQAVLELLSCQCSRSCKLPSCSCILNGLKCTDMCRLQDCTNKPEDDNDAVSVDGDDDDAEDSDW